VTLITGPALGPEGELETRARAGGYRFLVLDDLRREIHPGRDWRSYKRLRELLGELKPDVMHSHSSKAGILARRAAVRVGGMKVVHTIHGLAFHPFQNVVANLVYKMLERRAARWSDAILCVADAMAQQALAAGVGGPELYTTVYSGMETGPFLTRPPAADAFRDSLGLRKGDLLVMQVSRLAELKGHEFIIQAARGVEDERVHFCFVGDGRWRAKIEGWIRALGPEKEKRFHLTGLLPPERMPEIMHASDIVVHASLREGLARAIPQAMLAGRPVISFDVDGAAEVVDDRTGILLPPRDVDGLQLAIETLALNPPLRHQLGHTAQSRCRERFDHHRMVEQIEAVYTRLLAGA
jgi:glycosyltransferase involved in cell wall biosynthesis